MIAHRIKHYSFLVLLMASVSCGPATQNASDLTSENLDPMGRELGSGFDSITNKKLEKCVDVSQVNYMGAQSSDYRFLSDATTQDLIDESDVGIFGGVDLFGLATLKASGDVITTLSTTDESGAYVYKFEVNGKTATLPKIQLNDLGMDAYRRKDPLYFRKVCGDQFVHQVHLSAKLFVGVKYTFTSKEAKDKLLVQLKGSALWGLIKFSKEWSKENQELLKNVRISVEAFQTGGDPGKLEELKKSVETRSCSGTEAEKCAESLDRVLAYGRTDFPKQLQDLRLHDGLQGPAILVASVKSFSDRDIYDNTGKNLVRIEAGESTAPGKAAADSLSKLLRMEIDLKVESMRLVSLTDFPLSAVEKTTVSVARDGINEFLNSVPAVRELCNKALNQTALVEECSASTGRLLKKSEALLKPVELPSRQ